MYWTARAAALLAILAFAVPANANWFHSMCRDFRRNNCWPEPFVAPARATAQAPFGIMIANGWRAQNTLGDHHFDMETGELNEAGELKIREVLIEAPVEHRTIFVLRDRNPRLTANRVQSAQAAAEQVDLAGEIAEVVETSIRPRSTSAEYIDVIGRKYQATVPDPRLPARTASSEGEGS